MKMFLPLILLASPVLAQAGPAIDNPGFEEGLKGWQLQEETSMIEIVPEAARTGSMGVRLKDTDPGKGSSIVSNALPVQSGHTYRLTFYARVTDGGPQSAGVYFMFFTHGKLTRDEAGRYPGVRVDKADGAWKEYTLEAAPPASADTVVIRVHSATEGEGTMDFDDFKLGEITP